MQDLPKPPNYSPISQLVQSQKDQILNQAATNYAPTPATSGQLLDMEQLLSNKPKTQDQFYRRPAESLHTQGVPRLQADPHYPQYFTDEQRYSL